MNDLINRLNILGFNNYEARVYIGLLQFGTIKAGDLVKDLRIHREIVYTALQNLQEKGLVTIFVKNKVNYYTASSPEIITSKFKNLLEQAKSLKPRLESFMKIEKEVVKTIVGDENLNLSLEELLISAKQGQVFYIILGQNSSLDSIESAFLSFCNHWESLKLRNHLEIMAWDSSKSKLAFILPLKSTKTFLPDVFAQPQTIIFTDSKVISVFPGLEKISLILESMQIAKNYINYFNNLQSLSDL